MIVLRLLPTEVKDTAEPVEPPESMASAASSASPSQELAGESEVAGLAKSLFSSSILDSDRLELPLELLLMLSG